MQLTIDFCMVRALLHWLSGSFFH